MKGKENVIKTHLSHCYQGEYFDSCKYLDEDCPAKPKEGETKIGVITIKRDQLSIICRVFHKWFRVADCKNGADVDMYKAINKLGEGEYVEAMTDSLREAGIEVESK